MGYHRIHSTHGVTKLSEYQSKLYSENVVSEWFFLILSIFFFQPVNGLQMELQKQNAAAHTQQNEESFLGMY